MEIQPSPNRRLKSNRKTMTRKKQKNWFEELFWKTIGQKEVDGFHKELAEKSSVLKKQGRCPRCGSKRCLNYCFD